MTINDRTIKNQDILCKLSTPYENITQFGRHNIHIAL
jgi:hypothetical protein